MATQEQGQQNQPQQPTTTNTFSGGMVKDPIDLYKKSDTYTHARNMTNMLADGQLYGKSSEPSNIGLLTIQYTPIGFIYLSDDQWIVFSTNNTISEIGIFNDQSNTYTVLMNDGPTIAAGLPGLNFNTSNLITGTARRGYDCGFDVYWSDGGRNPDRILNTATCPWTIGAAPNPTPKTFPNPWIQNCTTGSGCIVCHNTNKIDIEQLRLAPLMSTPCLKLSKSKNGGQLLNGSYQVCIAYAVNGIKCTDYIAFSDVISLWNHIAIGNSFDVTISNIDDATKLHFTEMEVVVISMINQQIEARRLGIYSTNQGKITIDNIDLTLTHIPIERLPLSSPAIVSSDAIYGISNYLTRVGPRERPDFNYQPLANQIRTWWAAVEYPEDYYHIGGNDYGMNVSFLRGEVYAFFVRWVYSTGDKSASYHIPSSNVPTTENPGTYFINGPTVPGSIRTVAYGRTGVYVSNEIYPDHSPEVWGPLCGQNIMHHRFPDQADWGMSLSHFNPGGPPLPGEKSTISIMGVYFDNIAPPVDNNGNIIPDIVGYEILRATRDGHQSIVAKGMVNNMRIAKTPDNTDTPQLLANYPYNDLGLDVFLTNNFDNVKQGTVGNGFRDPLPAYNDGGFSNNIISFHSPDTTFTQPYIGPGKLELVMTVNGQSTGTFETPWKHPMFKVLSNFTNALVLFLDAIFVAVQAAQLSNISAGGEAPNLTLANTESIPFNIPLLASSSTLIAGNSVPNPLVIAADIAMVAALDFITFPAFNQQILDIIKGLIPARQYAMQYDSWGYYNIPKPIGTVPRITFDVKDYQYIKDRIQNFADSTINNLYRNDYVALSLDVSSTFPYYAVDVTTGPYPDSGSRCNIGGATDWQPGAWISRNIGSYYAAYRVAQYSQYGQIDSTKQVPIACVQQVKPQAGVTIGPSPVMFGGDTYINRYTEKNPMMFFNDWLLNAPEDFKYDYRNYMNVPYPMFWINNDVINYSLLSFSSDNRRLDGPFNIPTITFTPWPKVEGLFYVNKGYFYLFSNGVRDFFVESSVNVGYRDWEEPIAKRFYDPYASSRDFVREMFRSDVIKSNTFYKYDFSLSANRFVNQFISWSQCLRRDYDPKLAYSCFAYYPRRVVYSLPQSEEQMQDNWKIFLPNNYKDFNDKVSVIKDLHKTGAIFLMESSSPMMFAGVETIPSKSNTEYTVGTGLLFQQTLQSVNNIDDSYEYASCQGKLSVVNTPHGAFWISQKTGRVFNFLHGQLVDLGEACGLKYHLLKYLPSQLQQQFPNYPLIDNPVAGIGTQLIYDSVYQILYICKKDYVPNQPVNYSNGNWYLGPCPPGFAQVGFDPVTGKPLCQYCMSGGCIGVQITLGDPNYFDDASWTLSYDCVKKEFISWHDWKPSLSIPSKNHFITTNKLSGKLWRHNNNVQSYANYYGQNYPVEIEYFTNTGVNETILQSVEWLLESYQYAPNGVDKFLNYDESFDFLMVYNKEQNSTMQNMLLKPWNDPYAALNYPNWLGSTRQILYQKVENKYRVNDFYDYTADRGEFTLSNTTMFTTNPNGYTFTANTAYFNLLKPWNQQKRMRYTGTRIFMRKTNLGKNSLTIRYATTKNQYSPR